MAINEIVEKLNGLIVSEGAFTHEKDVVYFLVQLRKLMEREEILNGHKGIKFYCDWVVHPQKNKNHADISDVYDAIYEECVSHYSEEGIGIEGVLALLQFKNLKTDLIPLLDRYSLNRTILGHSWIPFTRSLLSILNDQPLIEPSDKIKEVVVTKQENIYIAKISFASPIIDYRGYSHPEYTYGLEYLSPMPGQA